MGEPSSRVEQLAFQLAGGGSIPTGSLQFRIEPCSHGMAKAFVERWHYSGRMPTGKNIPFALMDSGEPYAVIVYGIGVNPYQAAFLGVSSVIEIKRMCRSEPKKPFELSRFIRRSLKMVSRAVQFDAVVAFADPQHGHEGTVYKASGFTHAGMTNPEWHLVGDSGELRHRRFAFRHARRNGISVQEARAELGVSRVKTQRKHRWFLSATSRNGRGESCTSNVIDAK